jgi:hypothetical protein
LIGIDLSKLDVLNKPEAFEAAVDKNVFAACPRPVKDATETPSEDADGRSTDRVERSGSRDGLRGV